MLFLLLLDLCLLLYCLLSCLFLFLLLFLLFNSLDLFELRKFLVLTLLLRSHLLCIHLPELFLVFLRICKTIYQTYELSLAKGEHSLDLGFFILDINLLLLDRVPGYLAFDCINTLPTLLHLLDGFHVHLHISLHHHLLKQ